MTFWDKITGNDMTREQKAFEARAQKLPAAYQAAWKEVKLNLWQHSDFTGRNLMPVLDGVLGLLEESAAESESIEEVFGGDVKGFCTALAGGDWAGTYRDKWRRQLNDAVAKKLGR